MVREKIAVHLVHRVYGGCSLGLPFLTNILLEINASVGSLLGVKKSMPVLARF